MYSPKVFISEDVATDLVLLHPTTDSNYHDPAVAHIVLLSPKGERLERNSAPIPARGAYIINVDQLYEGEGIELLQPYGGLGTLRVDVYGQVLMPLVFNRNLVSGAWMVDHTRPAYGEIFTGYQDESHLHQVKYLRYRLLHHIVSHIPESARALFRKLPKGVIKRILR